MNLSTGLVNPIQINSTALGNQTRVVLPVQGNDTYYAQYKFVQGIPVSSSQNHVPLEKLRIINNMIDALQGIRDINARNKKNLNQSPNQNSISMDKVINQLGKEIHEVLSTTPPAFTSSVQSVASAGLAFQVEM